MVRAKEKAASVSVAELKCTCQLEMWDCFREDSVYVSLVCVCGQSLWYLSV